MRAAPPQAVLDAFGAGAAAPAPLAGGQGTAWRAGPIVLKPLDCSVDQLAWLAELRVDGLRLAVPLRAADGALSAGGWTAWPVLEGAHEPRWDAILEVADELHRGLAGLPRPPFLDARDDVWAVADRAAWGEADAGAAAGLPEVEHLLAARRPLHLTAQIVHGDLSGNVLFAAGLTPAVIDVSPYWRPAAYARAVVAVDARLWHGAGPELTARAAEPQLILRALLFRLLCGGDPVAQARAARPLVAEVLAGAGAA